MCFSLCTNKCDQSFFLPFSILKCNFFSILQFSFGSTTTIPCCGALCEWAYDCKVFEHGNHLFESFNFFFNLLNWVFGICAIWLVQFEEKSVFRLHIIKSINRNQVEWTHLLHFKIEFFKVRKSEKQRNTLFSKWNS